ncbi:MAG TPA: MraY family glycosyltransferase [Chryseolinea sp.]|nr:MraY family glycosyltransferase [Chryseolinea sp.]HPH45589.1 MraY family glycosyltransferase [Chryseolinea sp.]HPM30529.1 MraY family glycosyltransferase [Chryseolinea sp.]
MTTPLASAFTSFIIAFLIVPVIIKYSLQKNLFDIPGRRKIHKKVTPSMGGIAIFLAFFVSVLIWVDISFWKEIKFILVALFIIFYVGVRDDLLPLRPTIKLLGQLMAATLLILFFDLRLDSFYGLIGTFDFPPVISYGVTIFTIIIITNSFNLIDGLDGLAGSVALVALLAFGIWFYLVDDIVFSIFSFSMFGAVAAFLKFNWEPSEIFMGDTGALVIGLLLSILSIRFINLNYDLPADNDYKFVASLATAACIIIIPLIDTARIIILRLRKGQSPFKPDKSHIHHAIMRLGLNHGQTTLLLGVVHILFILMAIIFHHVTDRFLLPGIILLSLVLSLILDSLIVRRLSAKEVEEEED